MIHADTDGLLDRCHCGAVAGIEYLDGYTCRVRCTECCEQTSAFHHTYNAMVIWNNARRAERGGAQ